MLGGGDFITFLYIAMHLNTIKLMSMKSFQPNYRFVHTLPTIIGA